MTTTLSAHVPGTKVYLTCNDTCHNATGAQCDCICGGANHGCNHVGVQPQVVPMTIPERFSQHFPTDALETLQFHAKPAKVQMEHTVAADAAMRTDAVPSDGLPLETIDVEAELAQLAAEGGDVNQALVDRQDQDTSDDQLIAEVI